jgi:biopolymer transport protein ExbB/TolQ|tara:strand:- start:273 stop:566 length:294 start_codon:yes stop_codon:yes gene_type:complete
MWWILTILLFLISVASSTLLYFSLKRITQYEELILQFQQIIKFSSEKMKLVDSKGHYESDDETSFFFNQLKNLQNVLDGVFELETLDGEKENAKTKK